MNPRFECSNHDVELVRECIEWRGVGLGHLLNNEGGTEPLQLSECHLKLQPTQARELAFLGCRHSFFKGYCSWQPQLTNPSINWYFMRRRWRSLWLQRDMTQREFFEGSWSSIQRSCYHRHFHSSFDGVEFAGYIVESWKPRGKLSRWQKSGMGNSRWT